MKIALDILHPQQRTVRNSGPLQPPTWDLQIERQCLTSFALQYAVWGFILGIYTR